MDPVSALVEFWVGWLALQGGARGVAMNGAREIVELVGLVAAENLVELPEGLVSRMPDSLAVRRDSDTTFRDKLSKKSLVC